MTRISQYFQDGSLAHSLLTSRVTFKADNCKLADSNLGWTYIDVKAVPYCGKEAGLLITPFEGRLELSYEGRLELGYK